MGEDGERRETFVELTPPPARIETVGQRIHVAWDVELELGEAVTLLGRSTLAVMLRAVNLPGWSRQLYGSCSFTATGRALARGSRQTTRCSIG